MSDDFESQGWVRLGVAGVLAQEYAKDQSQFLQLLAQMLQSAFPGAVKTTTKGIFTKKLVGVEIKLGDNDYRIEDAAGGMLQATRIKVVRGIALKSEVIPMPDCLEEIAQGLETRAQESEANHKALSRLLGLN